MKVGRSKEKMHRVEVGSVSDWQHIPPRDRNMWQNAAAQTFGILTPANFITVLGIILVIDGLIDFSNGELLIGAVKITVGRILDIYDGYIAEYTKTKSLIGAAFDYTADMSLLAISLVSLVGLDVLPLGAALLIAAPKTLNILSWIGAVLRHTSTHVLGISKVATMFIWTGIIAFLFEEVIADIVSPGFEAVGWMFVVIGFALAVPASYLYARVGILGRAPKVKSDKKHKKHKK